MTALRRPIASLLNGVSQQAPSLRHPSQCEAQVNGYSDLADGLIKRMPYQHLKKLSGSNYTSAYMSVMNWSATEQFVLVIIDNDLAVFDMDGNSVTVNFPTGKAYLNCTGLAAKAFATVTVEGITYIANKEYQVVQTGAVAGGTYIGEIQDTAALLAIATPTNGDTYLVVGDGTVKAQGYYMQWDGTAGVWKEVPGVGQLTNVAVTTMPHQLTYSSATGQFTFTYVIWGTRAAGDVVTVPDPSFIDRYIKDVFFHRNRLGFLAGEYCILSQSGPIYENFFGQTATAQLDNDPVDLRAANVRVSELKNAIPFNRSLALFSDATQFIMSTPQGQVLTPSTAVIDVSTTYAANADCKPVTIGNSIFFPSETPNWASIREYMVSNTAEIVNVATDITQLVPNYIPAGVYKMALAEDLDTLFVLTEGDRQRIYVYKFLWQDGEQVQTSWSYWELDNQVTILNMETLESSLFLTVDRIDGVHLLRIDLANDPSIADMGFPVCLDCRISVTGSYSAGTDLTTFALPFDNTDMALQVVKGSSWPGDGSLITGVAKPTVTTVTVPGDWSAHPCYIGLPYEFRFQFSEQFVRKDGQNAEGSPMLDGHLHLRNMSLRYSDTGYIKATVVPRPGSTPYEYKYSGKTLGDLGLIIGTPSIGTGTFQFPIMANSKRVTITLTNDTHMPTQLVSAEWTGNYTTKKAS